jgi:Flp pilus assembly protein TadG
MPMGDAMSTKPRALVTLAAIDRLVSDRHGGVAIEFAFVIPIAILLTVGAVEVARAVSVQASISQAAKETVRVASVRGSASGAAATEAQLEAMAVQLADLADASTSAAVSWAPDNSPGSVVTVDVQTTFSPVALPFGASSYTFNATASMTIVR